MSPSGFVGIEALSTASSPSTFVAPPAEVEIASQPGPSGWHLTPPGGGSMPRCAGNGNGTTPPRSCASPANALRASAVPMELDRPALARFAVEEVGYGPLSSEQPCVLHPVAAGPTKVGAAEP